MKQIINIDQQANELFDKISILIKNVRSQISTTVNIAEVYAKFEIGKYIIENEQQGNERAEYGKKVLIVLSKRLTDYFGSGWSVETLTLCRKFYSVYSNSVNDVYEIQEKEIQRLVKPSDSNDYPTQSNNTKRFYLSWSHYIVLMRIENPEIRNFYEIEAQKENWSVRQLQRQYNSSLYERLALSRNKEEVMRLSREGQIVEKPNDIIKNPITLEFLGIQPSSIYSESKLESSIINKLQNFLLELGKGFLFETRQKRITFEEEFFYVDLVFYNRLLQCYVLIDLKTDKLTHQDLGQMLMYVNYYDRFVKMDFEKPTIGILLCKEKKDALVELTLPENSNIYAAEYALYLPDKKTLQGKLKQWIEEFDEANDMTNI